MTASTPEDIAALFLGPHAENMRFFREAITSILDEMQHARLQYAQRDSIAITDEIKSTEAFRRATDRLSMAIRECLKMLSKHSIPFWSPRYGAHMCTDLAMPAMLGYFVGMMWNPNNVTTEVSPFTTVVEKEVGKQLCGLFGYNLDPNQVPVSWGHITSGGTVANIESMWVARNLKFFPLTLRRATDGRLGFLKHRFRIENCEGNSKLFSSLSVWELLNLRPETVLDIPRILLAEYALPKKSLDEILLPYSIQSTGKEDQDTSLLMALEKHLQDCLNNQQAVYAVVAIIGTTEEGLVDRLSEIIAMRQRFQKKGLSFLIHADAAWGGYFATMIPSGSGRRKPHGFCLKQETVQDLTSLKDTDSITVDPHKSGYIPYPAGCLVYRDERMRLLIGWTSPYLSQGSDDSIGIYGIEGSKPGAAAVAIWLAHEAIGLNYDGYGSILRHVSFNRAMVSAVWATLSTENDSFILVPLELLPCESAQGSMIGGIEQDKRHIRENILGKTYEEISASHQLAFLRQLGSDLNINTFALNWKYRDGRVNQDTDAANLLMRSVVKRCSIQPNTDPFKVPLYLTSTEFSVQQYGKCVQKFKERLQLHQCDCNLFVVRNVIMSPFSAQGSTFQSIMENFRRIVEEEVEAYRQLYND